MPGSNRYTWTGETFGYVPPVYLRLDQLRLTTKRCANHRTHLVQSVRKQQLSTSNTKTQGDFFFLSRNSSKIVRPTDEVYTSRPQSHFCGITGVTKKSSPIPDLHSAKTPRRVYTVKRTRLRMIHKPCHLIQVGAWGYR